MRALERGAERKRSKQDFNKKCLTIIVLHPKVWYSWL
jgi:hypothetical protein